MFGRPLALRRRVLVNLKTGKAVSGVLWTRSRRSLVLKDPVLHQDRTDPVRLDGEVLIDAVNVDFVQVLPAVAPAGSEG